MAILVRPIEVDSGLASLGVTEEILRDAVLAGELERVSCTPLDPLSHPGSSAWGLTVRRLRESLLPRGWRQENVQALPLTVEPELGIAISVNAGSEATGVAGLNPTTKHQKGRLLRDQVVENRRQLNLFETDRRFIPTPEESERLTWILLIHSTYNPRSSNEGEQVARCELSLPAEVDEAGFVSQWETRIILQPVRLDGYPSPNRGEDEEDGDVEIDVAVTPRG